MNYFQIRILKPSSLIKKAASCGLLCSAKSKINRDQLIKLWGKLLVLFPEMKTYIGHAKSIILSSSGTSFYFSFTEKKSDSYRTAAAIKCK